MNSSLEKPMLLQNGNGMEFVHSQRHQFRINSA
jgi:hypothetical protein